MEEEPTTTVANVHQRVLKLRDAALGSRRAITLDSSLAHASYECVVDSLLALYTECSTESSGLSRDKHVARFLTKYGGAVKDLNTLRLTPEDFTVKAIIGRGHFGEVQVVHEKSTGDVYAMKIMRKSHILQQADAAFFMEERDIMAWTSSHWLTSLHYAFQDSSHLYLVMDFHPGGDLLSIMERNEGGMSETDARFYLSEIAAGLNDLHRLGFVHRDIKPENVLITRSGHIKLVDFGSAARLSQQGKVMESRLPVGTPEYIAPEVLTSLDTTADYGVCCDWWSLGIIAYELIYDVTPFAGDSTSKTYANIMNYEKSLAFPEEDKEASDDLRHLVCQLLTSPEARLGYSGLLSHPYFSSTDWNTLQQTIPPYIPSVCGPDDTANFEEFQAQRDPADDFRVTPKNQRGQRVFSGKSLPFVGFTFTRMDSINLDSNVEETDRNGGQRSERGRATTTTSRGEPEETSDQKKDLEAAMKELKDLRERKSSLERECVIYQSQLEDFHRKLEIEKVERRRSDSQALQLLDEVREQGKIAQQLREGEAKNTCEELKVVIEQLENERGTASKRARRLQDELQKVQQERDVALKRVSDYKSKIAETKQSCRKDIAALQTKLAKVTKDSVVKVSGMQNRVSESHARFSDCSKKLQESESERRKLEFNLQQAKRVCVVQSNTGTIISSDETAKAMAKKLEETESARVKVGNQVEDLKHQLEVKSQENSSLQSQCKDLSQQVKELEEQWQRANSRQEQLEASEWDLKTRLEQISREKERVLNTRQQAEKSMRELEKVVNKVQSENVRLENALKTQKSPSSKTSREEKERVGKWKELQTQLVEGEKKIKNLQTQLETTKKEVQQAKESVRSVQLQLSETSNLYIAQGEKLREVRRSRLELDQENTTLKTSLSRSKSEVKLWTRKFEDMSREMESLRDIQKSVDQLQKEIQSLISRNKSVKREAEESKLEKEEAVIARQEAEANLRDLRREMEAQELNVALLERRLSSVEEELNEARGAVEEERGREKDWKKGRNDLQTDLKTTEKRLEDAYAEIDKEKAQRVSMEKSLADTLSSLEKTAMAHGEEQRRLAEQLATQKQLACKYSDRVSELEKESRLRGLELKEAKKELETERSLSSKLYDDLHSLGREHGKLKAAHYKIVQETQETTDRLNEATVVRQKALDEQRVAAKTHYIQETKLQATIAQQSKLIDFLQKPSPPSRGVRFKFKLSRKSRDPAKEIAEWKKIKGLAAKQSDKNEASHTGSLQKRPISSPATSMPLSSTPLHTHLSLPTPLTSTTTSPQLSAPPVSTAIAKNVIHLPSTHEDPLSTVTVSEYPSSPIEATPTSTTISRAISPSSVQISTGQTIIKRVSVDIQKQSTPISETPSKEIQRAGTPQSIKAGKKRGLEGASAGGSSSKLGIEHNIPHRFVSKSAPLHKSHVCSYCKSTIKAMQKYVKCSYCGQVCHSKCSDKLPNNCGLPSELVDLAIPSSAKKPRQEQSSDEHHPLSQQQEMETGGNVKVAGGGAGAGGGGGGGVEEEKIVTKPPSLSRVRRRDETIKIGKVYVPKGEVKSECWLVLSEVSLNCYDRHPAGVTRKPLSSFCWTDPQNLVVVDGGVVVRPSPYMTPSRNQHLFAVEQHSVTGVSRAVFVTETIQEKIEWIEAVESAITRNSGVLGTTTTTTSRKSSPSHPPPSSSCPSSSKTGFTVTPVTRSRRTGRRPPRPVSAAAGSSPDSSVV